MNEHYLTPNQVRAAASKRNSQELRDYISQLVNGASATDTGMQNSVSSGVGGVADWKTYRPPMNLGEKVARTMVDTPAGRMLGMATQGIYNAGMNPGRFLYQNLAGDNASQYDNVMVPQNKYEKTVQTGAQDAYNTLMADAIVATTGLPGIFNKGAQSASKMVRWPSIAGRFLTSAESVPTQIGAAFGANALSEYADVESPAENAGWFDKAGYYAKKVGAGVLGGILGGGAAEGIAAGGRMAANALRNMPQEASAKLGNVFSGRNVAGQEYQPAYATAGSSVPSAQNPVSVMPQQQQLPTYYNKVEQSSGYNNAGQSSVIMPDNRIETGQKLIMPDGNSVQEQITRRPRRSSEDKKLIADAAYYRFSPEEMQRLREVNDYFAQQDAETMRRVYNEVAQNPYSNHPREDLLRMQLFDGRPDVVMPRGAAYMDENNAMHYQGDMLKELYGTEDNYGLVKSIFKHNMSEDDMVHAVQQLRSHLPLGRADNVNGPGYKYVVDSLEDGIPMVMITRQKARKNDPTQMFVTTFKDTDYPFRARSRSVYNPERDGKVIRKRAIGTDGREREIDIMESDSALYRDRKREIKKMLEENGIPIVPFKF